MNLLLDTHALLWFLDGNARLGSNARAAIEDRAKTKFVSIASLWEIVIKISIGRLDSGAPFDSIFPRQLEVNGFSILPIQTSHLSTLSDLPFHHRDPFDRLLIAQCIAEGAVIVSTDVVFDSYGVSRLW